MSAFVNSARFGAFVDTNYTWDTTGGSGSLSDNNQVVSYSGIASGTNRAKWSKTALSGKKYCEFQLLSKSSNNTYTAVGVGDRSNEGYYNTPNHVMYGRLPLTSSGCGFGGYAGLYTAGTESPAAGYNFGVGDRIGIAFDASTGKLWYRINGGSWLSGGDPTAGTTPSHTASAGTYYFGTHGYTCTGSGSDDWSWRIYAGAALQLTAAPSGFSAYQP